MHKDAETLPKSRLQNVRILGTICLLAALSKAAYLMLTIIGEDYHQKATSYKDSGSDFMRIARMYSTLEDVTYRCTARDVTALITHIFAGVLVNRRGSSSILVTATALMLLSAGIFAFETSFIFVLTASIIEGLASSLVEVSCLVSIGDVYNEEIKRRICYGLLIAAQGIGSFVLAPLLTIWYEYSGRRSLYLIFCGMYLLLLVILRKDKKKKQKAKCENCDALFSVPLTFGTLIRNCYIVLQICLLLITTEVLVHFYFSGTKPVWFIEEYFYENDWTSMLLWTTLYIPFILGIILIIPLLKFSQYDIGMIVSAVILAVICCYIRWFFHIKHIILYYVTVFCAGIVNLGVLSSLASYANVKYASLECGNLFVLINLMCCFPQYILHLLKRNLFEMLCRFTLAAFQILKSFLYNIILLPMKGLAVSV